jgi:drug/metabolite transporter (DMT)-like permease
MVAGVIFVAVWGRLQGVSLWPAPQERWPLAGLGVLFTVQIALLNSASPLTSPAYGVVLLNSYPVFVNLAGHFAHRRFAGVVSEEPLTPVRILGLAVALSGVALLAFGRPDQRLAPHPILGNLLMVTSAVLLGVRQVYTRWLVRSIDPVRSLVWQMALSVPLFLTAAVATEPMVYGRVTLTAVLAILFQGFIVAGLCFVIWVRLLRRHAAGTLSMFAFLVPVSGIALSAWIFGERLEARLFLDTLLVLAGVGIVIGFGQTRAE